MFDVEFDTVLEMAGESLLSGNTEVPPVEIGRGGGLNLNGEDLQLANFRDRAAAVGEIDFGQKAAPVGISKDQRPVSAMVAPNPSQVPARSAELQSVGSNRTGENFSNRENSRPLEINPNTKVDGLKPRTATNDSVEGPIRAEDNSKRQSVPEGARSEDSPQKGNIEPNRKEGSALAVAAKPEVQGRIETTAEPKSEKAKPITPELVATADRPAQIAPADVAPEAMFTGEKIQSTPPPAEKAARDTLMSSSTTEQSGTERARGFSLPETGLKPKNRLVQTIAESGPGIRVSVPAPGIEISFPKGTKNDVGVYILPKGNESALPLAQVRQYGGDSSISAIARRLPDVPNQIRSEPQQIGENDVGSAMRGEKPSEVEAHPKQRNAAQTTKLLALPMDVPRHTFVIFKKEDHGEFGSMIAKQDADIDLGAAKVGRSSGLVTMQPEPPRPVIHQLVDAARTTTGGTIEVKLAPDELGRVKLSLTPSEAGLSVTILTERPETLDLIRRNIEAFAQELRHQGHQSLAFQFGQEGGQGRNQPTPEDRPEMNDKKDHEHASYTKSQPTVQPILNGRLDLRI
ncbi:flagellar hook-length control protein FliK [Boseongicola aestuarii]|uniref:flagellar hook-length control protein FliK n=1 Tax=Boseongicola aestuarii TaxID=1470561 RepID=UPI001FE318B4|nr:flagellar hook-length control protein FliK [Boseongicola aestuarii]